MSGFRCRQCDYRSGKWLGRCPSCGAWGALEEHAAEGSGQRVAVAAGTPRPLPQLDAAAGTRTATGIAELDRVLGGGLVPGMVVLIGGEPGIGKSTLLLQAGAALAASGGTVLYVSGEESPGQLRLRAERLAVDSPALLVLSETDVDVVVETVRRSRPSVVIVDSIQAVRCAELGSVPGSVAQVRESAARLVELAKGTGTPMLLVGHVTKDGSLAGPRALAHVVDTVVQFEGDRHHAHRILRALKNRFGPADELGVFTMTGAGLRAVGDPSELFLAERREDAPGSAVLAAIEGTRPLLVEIQALVGEPAQGSPRRTSLGVDGQRVALVLAVLGRRAGVELAQRDVFVNVAGGLSIVEPAADLAVAAALTSSLTGRPLAPRSAIIGELGLTGEIRRVSRLGARLREAARLGFESAVVPHGVTPDAETEGLRLRAARDLAEALELVFDPAAAPRTR